jgi:hypothetical protein
MEARIRFQVVAAVAMSLLACVAAGCGDGSFNDNNDNGGPNPTTPVRTTTPIRTVTPSSPVVTPTPITSSTPVTVTFTADSTAGIQGFDLRITYPTAKGGFNGSADNVACTSAAPGFTKNDKDDGNLTLIAASTSNLTFPITITCTFDQIAGQTLAAGDLGVEVREVTQNGAAGDKTLLTATAAVT